ncbi:class III extradiol dioxygenase subunit B-like domain-containing protein [Streptomyces litchfieldiae]|uniref:Class III extradiol dioxygenase subunit B-like domain-containing protein n=1 Tax=Streptomyces litchfieldiae TaxID=3075543 RepID=A0ABU2N0A9_9ACTN|nr:class III extradiol dioxygenase subunit B-like domain-containing protein [Streptomyces sp. DSM 44938]MDT0347314.1 class III extradiol dioxygenase subunit B-like domain-containing protein [Streptomyces sp. DSM 44938]
MLVAAAVCPCPPLLVPDLAAGAAAELDEARAASYDAVGVLAAARPDRLVVVGPAEESGRGAFPAGTRGSLRGFGVAVEAALGAGEPGERELPPSLTVGAWLLERTAWQAAPVEALGLAESLEPERCAELGRQLAAGAERLALLVMGDGSACRSPRAPGSFDERAAAFDAAAARALGEANTGALAALDPALAEALHAAGRSGWQLLAGAAEGAGLVGRLLYDEAPYGVGYFVASWS